MFFRLSEMPIPPDEKPLSRLRRKIVAYSALYTLSALLLISLLSILPLIRSLKQTEEENLLNIVRSRSVAVEEFLSRITDISRQISAREYILRSLDAYYEGELTREELEKRIQRSLGGIPGFLEDIAGVTLLDGDGARVGGVGIAVPEHFAASASPSRNGIHVSPPLVIDESLYILVTVPIERQGKFLGTDLVLFHTHKLQRIVWNPSYLHANADSLLGRALHDRGEIFFPGRMGQREAYNVTAPSPYRQALEKAAQGETGLIRHGGRPGEEPDIVAFAPVPGTTWGLLVTVDQAQLYAQGNRLLFSVGGSVLVLALLGGGGIFLLLRPLTAQILSHSARLERLNLDLQQEISDRKQAEENLRRSESEWAQTFDAITDAVAILDVKGNILKMNRANISFISSLSLNVLSERRCKIHYGLEKSEELCPYTQMKTSRQPEFGELYEPQTDRYYHIAVYPLLSEDGLLWGAVHIAQDVTEQKKMENLKDEMISSVSHEMRTPLTAMLGFIEYLLENPVEPEQQREFLQTVHRETERLNDLVSNFLDLQRLQAQLETYQFEKVSVCALLQEMVQLFAMASKKHPVRLECPAGLPEIRGDARRLQQVLKNLLSNAIRYSPEGGEIVTGARLEGDKVKIWVQDQGLGIPPQALNKIFNRFYRVDDSARRIPGGIGLGLALVREVIRAHDGKVWVESTVGRGSTFYFTVPVMTGETEG